MVMPLEMGKSKSFFSFQELLGEFDPFKKKLDVLRNKGGDLIKHTSDPLEKTAVQKQLADANRQWLSLQAQAAEKNRQLQQLQTLSKDFTLTVEALEGWADQAEATLVSEPTWTDFDRVKEQLKQHRVILVQGKQLPLDNIHLNPNDTKNYIIVNLDLNSQQKIVYNRRWFSFSTNTVQSLLYLGSIGTILQRNYRKMTIMVIFL